MRGISTGRYADTTAVRGRGSDGRGWSNKAIAKLLPTFTENGAPVVLDGDAVITGVSSYEGTTLTLVSAAGASPDNVFGDSGTLILSESQVLLVEPPRASRSRSPSALSCWSTLALPGMAGHTVFATGAFHPGEQDSDLPPGHGRHHHRLDLRPPQAGLRGDRRAEPLNP
jgi:hypothetical protein